MCSSVIAGRVAATRRPFALATLALATLAALAAASPLGCTFEAEEAEAEGDVGVAAEAAMNPNAMNPNAMNPNAMNPNALRPSALAAGALVGSSMAPAALAAIADPGAAGDASREFLRYAVSCALRADQSFGFSWTDAAGAPHVESYPGLLGLAPSWATQALDATGQQWVSACLASRVNATGTSVQLSSRGTHAALSTTSAERAAYQTREAVFFGNVFGSSPRVYACYDPLAVLPSQLATRVCAQPSLLELDLGLLSLGYDCGAIEVLGPCYQLLGLLTLGFCSSEDPVGRYFQGCAPPSAAGLPAITTFLQGAIPW